MYAAEILSILLNNSTENQKKFGDLNGVDVLLITLAPFRKNDLSNSDEEEFVNNLFDSLCSCLLLRENQQFFLKAEGFELLIKMIKAKMGCRKPALKVLDYALCRYPEACEHFVEILGLKSLFTAFMKKGKEKKK